MIPPPRLCVLLADIGRVCFAVDGERGLGGQGVRGVEGGHRSLGAGLGRPQRIITTTYFFRHTQTPSPTAPPPFSSPFTQRRASAMPTPPRRSRARPVFSASSGARRQCRPAQRACPGSAGRSSAAARPPAPALRQSDLMKGIIQKKNHSCQSAKGERNKTNKQKRKHLTRSGLGRSFGGVGATPDEK
jgi:hypothetical protein